ncbi:hypothetical protein AB5I41_17620 [Sphingomonas sp. MMS24-JH45]
MVRVAAVATLPLLFVVVRLTDARLGMVGLLLTILLFALAIAIRRWRAHRDSPFAALVVAAYPAMFVAFVAATFVVGRLRKLTSAGNGARRRGAATRARINGRRVCPRCCGTSGGTASGRRRRPRLVLGQRGTRVDRHLLFVDPAGIWRPRLPRLLRDAGRGHRLWCDRVVEEPR